MEGFVFGSVKRLEEDHDEVGERFLEMSEDHGEVGDGSLGDLSCVARPGRISHIEQLSGEISRLSPIHIAPNDQPTADPVLHPFLDKPVPIGSVGLVEGSEEDTDPDEMPKSTSSVACLDGVGLFVETQVGTLILSMLHAYYGPGMMKTVDRTLPSDSKAVICALTSFCDLMGMSDGRNPIVEKQGIYQWSTYLGHRVMHWPPDGR